MIDTLTKINKIIEHKINNQKVKVNDLKQEIAEYNQEIDLIDYNIEYQQTLVKNDIRMYAIYNNYKKSALDKKSKLIVKKNNIEKNLEQEIEKLKDLIYDLKKHQLILEKKLFELKDNEDKKEQNIINEMNSNYYINNKNNNDDY